MKWSKRCWINIPITLGLVAGESLMKAMLAMLATGIGLLAGK